MALAVLIMAGGKGTRMKSDLPKVLHQANGRPLVHYVLDTAATLNPSKTVLIVGHKAEEVKAATAHYAATALLQEPQLGTGHAVMQAEAELHNFEGETIILSGDAPLVTTATLQAMLSLHHAEAATATLLTAELDDPTGYGRILRLPHSSTIEKIVEQKDATESEQAIREINAGVYVFNTPWLFEKLGELNTNNAQQEYYLTDLFGICFKSGKKVCAYKTATPHEILGINTPAQLQQIEAILKGEGSSDS